MAVGKIHELVALDSNFLIDVLVAGSPHSRNLDAWLRAGSLIQISAIAWSEYLCGPLDAERIPTARKLVRSVEPFIEEDAELASELFNRTGRRSRSHVDCMIAAHAIRRRAILATLNVQDFRRFEKFQLRLA
ncbi:MAG: type II toxin-antitoxin system VapC family toxin [Chthoniobacterales bacterium]